MGKDTVFRALSVQKGDEHQMSSFISQSSRRSYGAEVRRQLAALDYPAPAITVRDTTALDAIDAHSLRVAGSIRRTYNTRLQRALSLLPDDATDAELKSGLTGFIDATRAYNTQALFPWIQGQMQDMARRDFYRRNGIATQWAIDGPEPKDSDVCARDMAKGTVDDPGAFDAESYPAHPWCPHRMKPVNVDRSTLPDVGAVWTSDTAPITTTKALAIAHRLDRWAALVAKDWDESQHPRDEDGRFASGGGNSGTLTAPGLNAGDVQRAADRAITTGVDPSPDRAIASTRQMLGLRPSASIDTVQESRDTTTLDEVAFNNPNLSCEQAASFNSGWLRSSNGNPASDALQEAASQRFETPRVYGSLSNAPASDLDAAHAYLDAQIKYTQDTLASQNVDTVRLYRGYVSDTPLDETATIASQPLSAWSSSPGQAGQYAIGGEGHGYILVADVPASRIVATPETGMGGVYVAEYVVSGSSADTVQAIPFPAR